MTWMILRKRSEVEKKSGGMEPQRDQGNAVPWFKTEPHFEIMKNNSKS